MASSDDLSVVHCVCQVTLCGTLWMVLLLPDRATFAVWSETCDSMLTGPKPLSFPAHCLSHSFSKIKNGVICCAGSVMLGFNDLFSLLLGFPLSHFPLELCPSF
jgi:hypothetical protein